MLRPFLVFLLVVSWTSVGAQSPNGLSFARRDTELDILVNGQRFATYVWADPQTTRPYFKQVLSADGQVQLTRHHPPQPNDFDDHATYHPGIWWGFGDVGGNDYWRLKTKIKGGDFIVEPTADDGRATFTVRNVMLDQRGRRFCDQICRYDFVPQPHGLLMICESTLQREEGDFWLGDQEEMGLAVRVAKPITQKQGGRILDSQGQRTRQALRTQASDWCDYSGTIQGHFGGLQVMNDPRNFRKPWWHNVDTGLLVANPLGQSELSGHGKKRQNYLVKARQPFTLRYGLLVHLHESEEDFDPQAAYAAFLTELKNRAASK